MKFLVIAIIFLGACYYFFQPTIDNMFGKVTTQYNADIQQNEALK